MGVLSHFSEDLYSRDLGHIRILGGNWHFECRWFFRWALKIPSMYKNSEYESQPKKNDSDCNFCRFSLLVPYTNNFLVVCLCIPISHGVYSPPPPSISGANFLLYLVARGWENLTFIGDLLYWGNPYSFWDRELGHFLP